MAGRRLLTLAPWRRGPWLLLGHRGLVAGVVVATAIVVAALASVPVFLSSVGTRAVAAQAADRCGPDTGANWVVSTPGAALATEQRNPFAALDDRLGAPRRWVVWEGEEVRVPDGSDGLPVSVVAADGALDHVDVIAGDPDADGDATGWWITDRAADMTGLAVGDRATIGSTDATVLGIYRDRAGPFLDDYWCAEADLLLPIEAGGDIRLPPPVVLASFATAADVVADSGYVQAAVEWRTSIGTGVTAGELPDLIDDLACGDPSLALAWCADERGADADIDADRFLREELGSHLGYVSRRTDGIVATVAAGIVPIAAFAALAGLATIAAVGALWHERRQREVRLLLTRGVGPASVATKALLEMSVPIVVGATLGLAASLVGVRSIGPSWVVDDDALVAGAGLGVLGLGAVIGVVAAMTSRRAATMERGAHHRRGWGWVPWEVLLAWATLVAYRRLGQWGVPVNFREGAPSVDVWGLLFPVLFLLTAVLVARRMFGVILRLLRARPMTATGAFALAVRRMHRARRAVLGLAASAAVAAGVLGLAVSLQHSLATTLEVKGLTFTGSDVAVRLGYHEAIPDLDASTVVTSPGNAKLDLGGEQHKAVLRVIDPDTFADGAFWDSSLAEPSLDAILAELATPRADGSLPAVLVEPPGDRAADRPITMTVAGNRTVDVPIQPIPGVHAFPGMRRAEPTVFVSASALQQMQPTLDVGRGLKDLWVRGDRELILGQLDGEGVQYDEIRSPSMVADRLAFQTVDWTFDFVVAVGSLAGVIVLAGVVVYLDAAHRSRLLGYTFLRRMGLSTRTHRRAIVVELLGSVVVGVVVGLAMALLAVRLAYRRIDPVPGYPPLTVFRPAVGFSVLVVVGCVVVGVVTAWLAQRRLDGEDPSEVLRAGL